MPEMRSAGALLGQTALLAGVPAPVLETIASATHEEKFASGQLIFSRGDPGHAIYIVRSGRIRLSILTGEGREFAFAHAAAGDVFGEIAVLDGSFRSADATALTDVVATALPAQACRRLIASEPEFANAMIQFLCARLRDVSGHLEDIALLPTEARVARFLLNRVPKDQGTDAPRARIDLGMSQTELALLLGASRPKVNAALMVLERSGAIKRLQQGYEIDLAVLIELAGRE